MRQAMKSKKKIVKAYQLGSGSNMEKLLLEEGTLVLREDGKYELFSQEAVNRKGEVAVAGDYFKVDEIEGKHFPYPNEKSWFEANHTHLQGDEYEQVNKPLYVWQASDPRSEEIEYLINSGKLTIKEDDAQHYFNAFLWGADLSAAKDATVIFYNIDRDNDGQIIDIGFNFIAKAQFEADYEFC